MKSYIYDAVWTQELEDIVEASPVRAFIMELFYKHGLRVYKAIADRKMLEFTEGDEQIDVKNLSYKFMMTLDGLPYCQVFTEPKVTKSGNTIVEYCLYSIYYEKLRGRSRDDRRTVRSSTLSGMMRSLEKNKVLMDSAEKVMGQHVLEAVPDSVYRSNLKDKRVASYDKPHILPEDIFILLESAVNGVKPKVEKLEFYKKAFDILAKEADDVRHAEEKVKALMSREYTIIGENDVGDICVGKGKYTLDKENLRRGDFSVTDSFQLLNSLEDYEEFDRLKPVLTMYKVVMESPEAGGRYNPDKIIQHGNGYSADLDVIQATASTSNPYFFMRYLFIPNTEESI